MKITYYCAMSKDEFIATEDGDVSWLDDLDTDESESSYEDFFASIDGLIMGIGTYDFVFDYGSWPYGNVPAWIFTSKKLVPLAAANLNLVKTIDDFLLQSNGKNLNHIWLVGGGKLASSFLERRLLTHISITEALINLGRGITLFANHKLEDFDSRTIRLVQKKGFREIDIALGDCWPLVSEQSL